MSELRNPTVTAPPSGSALYFGSLRNALAKKGLGSPLDPITMEPHQPTKAKCPKDSNMIFLEPRADGYIPVLCTCHRIVRWLLTPAQAAYAKEYAVHTDLSIF